MSGDDDLAAILADDAQIDVLRADVEAHRQAFADGLGMAATAPVMSALARLAALTVQLAGATEAMAHEVRLIQHYLGGGS